MIVIYDKANTLTLPYIDEKKSVRYVKFVPGRNVIESAIWALVKECNEARFEHYDKYLHALNEEAAGDEHIDYAALTVRELDELIDNTFEVGELGDIEAAEKGRDTPRTTVLKAIDKQVEKISNTEARLAESRE